MQVHLKVLTVLAIVLTPLPAQQSDVSGTWSVLVGQAPAALPAAPSPIFGTRFGLDITAARLTVTRPVGEVSVLSLLPIDGATVATPVPGRLCEGDRVFHESAAWEDGSLVVTVAGTTPSGGGAMVGAGNRTLFRLESADRLVVEGTIVQQGQRRQVGTVYARTSDSLPKPRPEMPISGVPATVAQAAWIGTTWVGTTGALTTEERWTPPASGGMMAISRTLRGPALAGFEFLCIVERGGSLVYLAMPDARMPPTVFGLTAIDPNGLTFENPAHDYPKMVRYAKLPDGGLETTIAGANGARPQKVVLKRLAPTP